MKFQAVVFGVMRAVTINCKSILPGLITNHKASIYINDINQNIQSSVRLFADDCVLYRVIKSSEDCRYLQEDLNHLVHYTNLWQMNLNSDK